MADEEKQALPTGTGYLEKEVTCPKCGHTFMHTIKEGLRRAGEALGNAIGDAKFGG